MILFLSENFREDFRGLHGVMAGKGYAALRVDEHDEGDAAEVVGRGHVLEIFLSHAHLGPGHLFLLHGKLPCLGVFVDTHGHDAETVAILLVELTHVGMAMRQGPHHEAQKSTMV